MKELFLHIGTQKTGTTSIQTFLKLNKLKLSAKEIYVPTSLDVGNGHHRWITLLSSEINKVDSFSLNLEFKSKEEKKIKIEEKLDSFNKEVEKKTHGKWIISCEHLQSELTSQSDILKLKNILINLFDKVTVILYIRNPLDTVVSLWSTQTKYGAKLSRISKPNNKFYENVVNHKNTIIRWQSVFGRENLKVCRFQKKDFFRNNLIEDFCSKVEIEFDDKYKKPPLANKSLSLIGMKSLGYINNFIPHFEKQKSKSLPLMRNRERENIASYIEEYTSKDIPYSVSKDEAKEYDEYYKESDEWVRKEFFNEDKELWEITNKYIDLDNQEIMKLSRSEQMLCNLIIKLWKEKQQLNKQINKNKNIEIKL